MKSRSKQSRGVEKKAGILDAAIDLMFLHGLPGVTHRQVAARANVPVGSVGYYFHSRDELVVQAIATVAQRRSDYARKLREIIPGDTPLLIELLLETCAPEAATLLAGWVKIGMDCARESEEFRKAWSQVLKEALADVRAVLTQAGRTNVSADVVFLMINGAAVAAILRNEDPHPAATRALTCYLDVL
ncbi:TetR/AcrR family transcriptional regulator [Corynebacterium uterequi]|uniref:Transcriptional regulator, TetR family n=1 Tax=Corynebacterium uterequi TaxID=1072256 RepID=A0A0G3HIC3_9CORY|nr:TetR family transcriptional regulator [Corynebacterium uterequi]AKK11633.1 transcriptional regulator, TetR family [Corynebacterium uterequi]